MPSCFRDCVRPLRYCHTMAVATSGGSNNVCTICAIRYLQECQSQKSHETIYILCDCIAAINTANNKSESNKYAGVLCRLQDLCDVLQNSSASVKLVHIPGHAGIEGNEIADVKAREVARDLHLLLLLVSSS